MFGPTEPEIDQTQFQIEDYSAMPYGPCKDGSPSNAPVPRDMNFAMMFF